MRMSLFQRKLPKDCRHRDEICTSENFSRAFTCTASQLPRCLCVAHIPLKKQTNNNKKHKGLEKLQYLWMVITENTAFIEYKGRGFYELIIILRVEDGWRSKD